MSQRARRCQGGGSDAADLKAGFGAETALLLRKLNLNSLDEAEETAAVEQIHRCIDEAAEIGAARLAFLSGPRPR